MDIWVVSTFWLLWKMLLWTFVYKFLWAHIFSFLLGIYLWVKLWSHIITMFKCLRNCQIVFQSVYTILYYHQQSIRFSVSPNPHQNLLLSTLFFFKIFFFFLDRREGREEEGGKHLCVIASRAPPAGVLACNPGLCSDWELNLWPFGWQARAQSTESHQPGLLSIFFIIAIFLAVKQNSIVDLISLMSNDVEYLFMYLRAILLSFLEQCLFKSFAHF